MRIDSMLARGGPVFSFEFFPPRTEEARVQLQATLQELSPLEPAFASVTYGAGGSTRVETLELAESIEQAGIEPLVHLTCLGHTRAEICALLLRLRELGMENLLCLRGDPPKGQVLHGGQDPPGEFRYASELVELVQTTHREAFCLGGACYPEMHPQSMSPDADMQAVLIKVRAGVRFLVTQLFFDNADYFRFVDRARASGVDVPILPGIMPVTNFAQLQRFTGMCGARIPRRLLGELERFQYEPETVLQIGIAHATAQCVSLLQQGAPGVHFFTLNRSRPALAILQAIRSA